MWWDIVKTSWRWTAQHSRNDTKQKMEMINNKFQFNISCNMTNIQIIISIYVYVFFVGFQLLVATRFLHLTLSRWCVCVFLSLSLCGLYDSISQCHHFNEIASFCNRIFDSVLQLTREIHKCMKQKRLVWIEFLVWNTRVYFYWNTYYRSNAKIEAKFWIATHASPHLAVISRYLFINNLCMCFIGH